MLGYIVRGPLGGLVWHHLQYLLSLAELGHDVYFFEDSDDYPSCYDPSPHSVGEDPSYGLAFAKRILDQAGFGAKWAYFDAHTRTWHGACSDRAVGILRGADVLLNVSGVNPLRDWALETPHRVFIDTDPAFTQIRHLTDEAAR